MFHVLAQPRVDADVVVVGAGPAGAATAAHLAAAGVDVLLLDRKAFPRDKVCGDFVSTGALGELQALGVAIAAANAVRGAALHLDGEPLIEAMLPGTPWVGAVMPREQLDALIVDAAVGAGARLLERHSVTSFRIDGGMATLDVEPPSGPPRRLRARLVVGADGSGSLVARTLHGTTHPRADWIVAVRAYYDRVRGPADRADLYFASESFPGYAWVFPTGEGRANVGVGMVLETRPPHDRRLRLLLDRLVERDPALRGRLEGAERRGGVVGWPLATYSPHLAASGERTLLVGDAAGLINPLNGEGIQYALGSARWAAEAVLAAAGDYTAAGLAGYERRLRAEVHADMSLARLVVQLISNRTLNPFWLLVLRAITRRAQTDPEYLFAAGGMLVGLVPSVFAAGESFFGATVEETLVALASEAVRPRELAGAARAVRTLVRDASGTAEWARLCSQTAVEFALGAAAR